MWPFKKKKEEEVVRGDILPTLFNEDRAAAALEKIKEAFNKEKLSVAEIIVVYGNLGYILGASIAGFKVEGPGIDELNHAYNLDPTIDLGLMIQGLLITSWVDDFLERPKLSSLAKKEEK